MRYLNWVLRVVLFVALLGFALKNNEPVVLRYFFGFEWQTPLVVALLGFFAVGVCLGILAMVPLWLRLRVELRRARPAAAEPGPAVAPAADADSAYKKN